MNTHASGHIYKEITVGRLFQVQNSLNEQENQ